MSKTNTKAIDLDLLSIAERKLYDSLSPISKAQFLGYGDQATRSDFDTPSYISTPNELVQSKGNSFIVMGLDRPGNTLTQRLETHSAAIDLVAGRKGFRGKARTPAGKLLNVDPDMVLDAARVYISQRSNPDGYLRLAAGSVGNTSEESPRSTVALKADTIRIVGRENIKLVTRTDSYNSQGGKLTNISTKPFGIDLIGCNDDRDIQPMVKGDNLRACLTEVMSSINELRGLFNNYVDQQRQLTIALINHTHHSPFYGILTSPDFATLAPAGVNALINNITDVTAQLPLHATKCAMIETSYLGATEVADSVDANGKSLYILSKYNNTN
jgi:hypothetical protein